MEVTHACRGVLCLNKEQREIAENKTGITPAFANAQITAGVALSISHIDLSVGLEEKPTHMKMTVLHRRVQRTASSDKKGGYKR